MNIAVKLDGQNCLTTVNGAEQIENGKLYKNNGVIVQAFSEKVLFSVPSCGGEDALPDMKFIVKCRGWKNTNIMEFQVDDGRAISSYAHGLIG